jgi:hypothetical protein
LRSRNPLGVRLGDAGLLARVAAQVEEQLVVVGAEAPDELLLLGAHAVRHEAAVADLRERRPRRLAVLERALQRAADEVGGSGAPIASSSVGITSTPCTWRSMRAPRPWPPGSLSTSGMRISSS